MKTYKTALQGSSFTLGPAMRTIRCQCIVFGVQQKHHGWLKLSLQPQPMIIEVSGEDEAVDKFEAWFVSYFGEIGTEREHPSLTGG